MTALRARAFLGLYSKIEYHFQKLNIITLYDIYSSNCKSAICDICANYGIRVGRMHFNFYKSNSRT